VRACRYGTKQQRQRILSEFYGHMKQMLVHKEASHVVEFAYTDICNGTQREAMLCEFYSDEYAILKVLRWTHSIAALSGFSVLRA
jgi:pumilio homology domain family member 6